MISVQQLSIYVSTYVQNKELPRLSHAMRLIILWNIQQLSFRNSKGKFLKIRLLFVGMMRLVTRNRWSM